MDDQFRIGLLLVAPIVVAYILVGARALVASHTFLRKAAVEKEDYGIPDLPTFLSPAFEDTIALLKALFKPNRSSAVGELERYRELARRWMVLAMILFGASVLYILVIAVILDLFSVGV